MNCPLAHAPRLNYREDTLTVRTIDFRNANFHLCLSRALLGQLAPVMMLGFADPLNARGGSVTIRNQLAALMHLDYSPRVLGLS